MPVSDNQVFWGRINDFESLAEDFARLRKKKKLKANFASINLPMQFCELKTYDFPKGYMKKSSLDWEIQQNFISDTSVYRFDNIEVGKSENGVYDVLISALAKTVDERASLLLTFQMNAVSVEPDIISLYNGLVSAMGDFPSETVLLVDIAYPYSSFAFVNKGVFLPGVPIKVSRDFLTEDIRELIPEFALDVIKAFNKRFELIGFDMIEKKPQLLIVSGIPVNQEIADFLAQEMEMTPYRKNPLENSPITVKVKKPKISWHSYIKALGLALRS